MARRPERRFSLRQDHEGRFYVLPAELVFGFERLVERLGKELCPELVHDLHTRYDSCRLHYGLPSLTFSNPEEDCRGTTI